MLKETTGIIDEATISMKKATEHFESELVKIRAGKANPTMLDGITVDYYGTPTPINPVVKLNSSDE